MVRWCFPPKLYVFLFLSLSISFSIPLSFSLSISLSTSLFCSMQTLIYILKGHMRPLLFYLVSHQRSLKVTKGHIYVYFHLNLRVLLMDNFLCLFFDTSPFDIFQEVKVTHKYNNNHRLSTSLVQLVLVKYLLYCA